MEKPQNGSIQHIRENEDGAKTADVEESEREEFSSGGGAYTHQHVAKTCQDSQNDIADG